MNIKALTNRIEALERAHCPREPFLLVELKDGETEDAARMRLGGRTPVIFLRPDDVRLCGEPDPLH